MKELAKLIDIRNGIIKCDEKADMLEDLDYKIADMEAIEIRNKLLEVFNQFNSDNSENINISKMSPFPVYGRLTRIGGDKERWVWDAMDRGFGTAAKVVAWAYFAPPTRY